MIIIAAMSTDRIIGKGNGMPWEVPEEYQQYLNFVRGSAVIMGRRTYEIFGRDLCHETQIIMISRSVTDADVPVATSLPNALKLATGYDRRIFVAGGSSIYAQAIPLADEMYLSTIKGSFDGDTYFPEFDTNDWTVSEERDEPDFVFRRYLRRPKSP